jgi:hypothetical protein
MATWQEAKKYIYSNYTVSEDTGNMLTLLFNTGNDRSQMVFVSVLNLAEDSQIVFASPVANRATVSAERLLDATIDTFFGIRSVGQTVVLTHASLLATLDAAEIDYPMGMVTQAADEMERRLGLGDTF